MRIVISEFISLDGVVQAPGGEHGPGGGENSVGELGGSHRAMLPGVDSDTRRRPEAASAGR